jgi:hypothetical protein
MLMSLQPTLNYDVRVWTACSHSALERHRIGDYIEHADLEGRRDYP